MLYDYLIAEFTKALSSLGLPTNQLAFDVPKVAEHGSASTNIAMILNKQVGKPPRILAQEIIDAVNVDSELVSALEIAGPGFINIRCTAKYYTMLLSAIREAGALYGRCTIGDGKKANVEYVSANPTGPLHPGHGRNIMLGDTIARTLEWNGYSVTREYYFNNAGNQMNNLARSIYSRYRQALGETDFPFDEENGYKGEYISIIAKELVEQYGNSFVDGTEEHLAVCRKKGEEWCFASIKQTLARLDVHHDVFFNEHSLYEEGKITETVEALRSKGLVYESEGATWIKTSELGLEKDKVIIKSSGEPTYRLPDMAYHKIKCERGDDIIVDIFGADHISTVQEVIAGVKAMGYDTDKIKVVLHQMVSFMKDGAPYKLSKRNGEQYTLDDLIQDLGIDVVRFFFSMRSADTQLMFDINVAQEQSDKNPVFYLQYAHARTCSIFTKAVEQGVVVNLAVGLDSLEHPSELALIKILSQFPMVVARAGVNIAPHIIAEYLREVSACFHTFYHDCKILGIDNTDLMNARFALADSTRTIIKNGLQILGISAPEKM